MMFSLRFAFVALLALTISGQQYDGTKPSINTEKGYPFGKLRISEDGKKEEVILINPTEQTQLKQDQKQNVQPLPSPCVGTRPLTRLAHPGDKTKYIYCRDEFHYEIFSCPNNGEYNYQTGSCEAITPIVDRCAEEKPCLNDGQCSILSNSTFKCTCRSDWTGERCETPINSCVKKPCGPNAECRVLKTNDYEQDYVCVCHSKKGYGLNCDDTVPNPCLKSTEQFFPFAYSQHAYLQCDGEIVYFQPCGPVLYWNQEEKVCDRKKPPKLNLPALLKTYGVTEEDLQPSTTTTTTTTTPSPLQEEQREKPTEENIPFIPARVADRQQGFYGQNMQNKPWSQPQQNQQFGSQQWLNQVPTPNAQNEQHFVPQSQTYQNFRVVPTTTTTPVSINVPSWQNQQQFQDQNQGSAIETTTTTPTSVNIPSWQQNRPMNQWNGYQAPQPWQNYRVVTTTTTPASVNVPSWQNQQQQQQFQDQDQESDVETTTTTTLIPSTTTLPSWQQNRPMNQWNGYQVPQSQSWQNFRVVTTTTTPASVNVPSWQNQQQQFQDQDQESDVETTTTTTLIPSTTTLPSWLQTRPMNQWNGYQAPQPWQNYRVVTTTTTPASVNVPSWQNQQQQFQDQDQESDVETTTATTFTPSTTTIPSWQQSRPMNQWSGYQVPQSQSWQNFRVVSTQQPIFQTTTVPTVITTPVAQNQIPSQNQFQQSSVQTQEQSWQVKPTNQWNSNHAPATIGFQPQQKYNTPLLSQSQLNSQSFSTLQPILPLTTTTTPQPAVSPASQNQWNTNQFSQPIGLTQQQGVAPIQKSLDQIPSWSTNQQLPSEWSQTSGAGNNGRFQNLIGQTRSWPQNSNMEKQFDQSKTLETGSWNFRA